jgi:hypothetical protein
MNRDRESRLPIRCDIALIRGLMVQRCLSLPGVEAETGHRTRSAAEESGRAAALGLPTSAKSQRRGVSLSAFQAYFPHSQPFLDNITFDDDDARPSKLTSEQWTDFCHLPLFPMWLRDPLSTSCGPLSAFLLVHLFSLEIRCIRWSLHLQSCCPRSGLL